MNQITDLLKAHKSDRWFSDQAIDEAIINEILTVAIRAPTSKNCQALSAIVVKDKQIKKRLAQCAGGQIWIETCPVFICLVIDFHKINQALARHGKIVKAHETAEGLIAATTDAGIALGLMMAAARSFNLGIVPIGGIRADMAGVIEVLKIPPYCIPVAGMCLGYVTKPESQKPRLPLPSFRHDETYQDRDLSQIIERYDADMVEYWAKIGRLNGQSWSQSMSETYDHNYRPTLKATLTKQGFKCE